MEEKTPVKKLLISVAEYCEIADVGTTMAYQHIAAGEVVAVRDGRRTKITLESAEARIARLPRFTPGSGVGVRKAKPERAA